MIIVVVAQFSRAALQATISPSSWAFAINRSTAGIATSVRTESAATTLLYSSWTANQFTD